MGFTHINLCKPCEKIMAKANHITVFSHVVEEHVKFGKCVRWQYMVDGATGGFYDSPRDAFEAGFKQYIEIQRRRAKRLASK